MPAENASSTELTGAEVVARGKALYEARIRALVEPADIGRFIAVDVGTGDFFVADEYLDAAHAALDKHPGARLYGTRIGYVAMAAIGARLRRTDEVDSQ